MEGGWSYEQKTLISELIQGANLAKQLRAHLSSASSAETREVLINGIINSFEKALMVLKWSGPVACQPQRVPAPAVGASGIPGSPLSVNGSPCSDDFDRSAAVREQFDCRDTKMLPKWTDQVRISPDTGLEGPQDDGYSWRKYGQKDILGAKYPRSYYRCTYRNTQNCCATKQVQRSDDDHTVFEITYRGKHTCLQGGPSTPAPPSPEKQELKQVTHGNHQQDQSQDALARFRNGLRVDTENLDGSNITEMPRPFSFRSSSFGFVHGETHSSSGLANNTGNHGGNLSSPFLSPSTPESNYFSLSPCPMTEFGQIHNRYRSESDPAEIISATNSSANSPILDLDFSLEEVGIEPNFPFNTDGFLPKLDY
ncbi:hypothetical protein CDL15_Pgr028026 [Punica granatum]|uniref:WRKY domain-containing protein n=1 Tax=Punica granatum TaxID=22663 RepID=A0A218XKN2_PUNGR|nr:hypothetical protein CDL15_Pgr028026 [Punica granatum]